MIYHFFLVVVISNLNNYIFIYVELANKKNVSFISITILDWVPLEKERKNLFISQYWWMVNEVVCMWISFSKTIFRYCHYLCKCIYDLYICSQNQSVLNLLFFLWCLNLDFNLVKHFYILKILYYDNIIF